MAFIQSQIRVLLALGTMVPSATVAGAVIPEVRAVSLTATSEAISTPVRTEATMKRLHAIGFNTVYIECYRAGFTGFPSEQQRKTIGEDRDPALTPKDKSTEQRDLVIGTLIEAHRNGLVYIAAFGPAMVPKQAKESTSRISKDWLAVNKNGGALKDDGDAAYLNPIHPEVNDHLRSIIKDAVNKYDLDGVQLDLRWPSIEAGYDDYTKRLYAKEHEGHEPPSDASDKEWRTWRASKLTEQAAMLASAVRNTRPGLIVSVRTAPYPLCIDRDLCDWRDWAADKSKFGWTEFVIHIDSDAETNQSAWSEQLAHMANRRSNLLLGMTSEPANTTWENIRTWLNLSRGGPGDNPDATKRGGGHVLAFRTLDSTSTDLADFYKKDGAMIPPHPHFTTRTSGDWRPASTPLIPTGKRAPRDTEQWKVPEVLPAEYEVTAKENGVRKIVMHLNLTQARPTLAIPNKFTEPELLIDRRPELATK